MSNYLSKAALAVCLLLVLCTTTLSVSALTARELYELFDIDYKSDISEEDLTTIQQYNYAKRYVQMFRYVADSSYDANSIKQKINATEQRLREIESELLGGYYLSSTAIFELESEYQTLTRQLQELKSCIESVELDVKELKPEDVPSYEDFIIAVANKNLADSRSQLGSNSPSIMTNIHLVSDFDDTTVTYASAPLSIITSLFNGIVIYADEDTVTVYHYNNIYTSYKGLTPCVEKGNTIGQGQCIGYSSGILSVRMKVGGEFVDIHSYLEDNNDL